MSSAPKTILIVEDDLDIVLVLTLMFEDEGYRVVTADNCDALELSQESELPQAILLDMLLPAGDGREIARQLKCQPATQHIPIVMISAYPHAEEEARAAGADDFLAKPFEFETLLAKVASYLTA